MKFVVGDLCKLHIPTCSSSLPVASCWYSLFPQEKASPSTKICIYNYRNIKSYLGVPHTTDTSLVLKATFISISQFFKSTKYMLFINYWMRLSMIRIIRSRRLLSTSAFSLGDNKLRDMHISYRPISIIFLSFIQNNVQVLQNMNGWFERVIFPIFGYIPQN